MWHVTVCGSRQKNKMLDIVDSPPSFRHHESRHQDVHVREWRVAVLPTHQLLEGQEPGARVSHCQQSEQRSLGLDDAFCGCILWLLRQQIMQGKHTCGCSMCEASVCIAAKCIQGGPTWWNNKDQWVRERGGHEGKVLGLEAPPHFGERW